MTQVVVRVILEPDRRSGCPLGVLLCNSLLGDAGEPELLSISQLRNERSLTLGVVDYRRSNPLIRAHRVNDKVASVHFHDFAMGCAFGVQGELDAAIFAILLAVAVAGVNDIVGAL